MTEFLKVLFLAALQGVAEFLPVSSSAHLVVAKALIGLHSPGLTLELALHAGTLVSVCVFYWRTIRWTLSGAAFGDRAARRYVLSILLSMVPCGIAFAFFGDWVESAFGHHAWFGVGWLITATLLFTIRRTDKCDVESDEDQSRTPVVPFTTALCMGLGQAFAMFPGVSRSGTTIWVARRLRLPPVEAARFSFLMSLPVIGGASLLTVIKSLKAGGEAAATTSASGALPVWMLGTGAVIAAVVGVASLSLLVRMLERGRFWVFGVYCALAGLGVLFA